MDSQSARDRINGRLEAEQLLELRLIGTTPEYNRAFASALRDYADSVLGPVAVADSSGWKKLREFAESGWYAHNNPATAFVSMKHPKGGAWSLIEVRTYGTPLTLGEADSIANSIAAFIQSCIAVEPSGQETQS